MALARARDNYQRGKKDEDFRAFKDAVLKGKNTGDPQYNLDWAKRLSKSYSGDELDDFTRQKWASNIYAPGKQNYDPSYAVTLKWHIKDGTAHQRDIDGALHDNQISNAKHAQLLD